MDLNLFRLTKDQLLSQLKTTPQGLTEDEARRRLAEVGPNEPARKKKRTAVIQLGAKFFDPLVLVLLVIAGFSLFFGEKISAGLVFAMAVLSVFLSFFQEFRAGRAAERLSEMVRATATVYRNGRPKEIKMREVVPGDVVDLFAGDMIPADLRVLFAKDLFINQSSLTGESFPVEKSPDVPTTASSTPADLTQVAFMGSSVVSGTGIGVVVATGLSTQFGQLSQRLSTMEVESSFDRGVHRFALLMIRVMLVMVVAIFSINWYTKGDLIQALLFSLAVAVGLTPEMMPMIVAINLSKGALAMSKKDVIVKRLNAIQNFGAMDVLCTDKTGTLTLDRIVLERNCDVVKQEDHGVLRLAYMNSFFQTGLKNILDRAILRHEKIQLGDVKKVDEVPFDFSRKIMSVVVAMEGQHRLIAKGAPEEVFRRCARFELDGEILEMESLLVTELREECDELSRDGFRVLALAYRDFPPDNRPYTKDDERDMILRGYVAFLDPPKPTARRTIESLRSLGIDFKVLTGDNDLVTQKVCGDIGLDVKGLLTGDKVEAMSDEDLRVQVQSTSVFARVSPLQKERIIRSLHANGHVVGYLGDGINDAAALKAADVGISVNNAVDIAKESADLILLKKSLMVLADGVLEGRKTFGNILKYIKMGSSSNFGNMLSVTGASLFLPFLPMLPIQVLLNNFLYDLSQVAIPSDSVDEDYLRKSRPWNIGYIRKNMACLGPVSSLFDFVTFGVLLWLYKASPAMFQTGWFMESLCTQTFVIHMIRTSKKPFLESSPSPFLLFSSIYIVTIGLMIPYLPMGRYFGFVPPPISYLAVLFVITGSYLWTVNLVKGWFIRRFGYE